MVGLLWVVWLAVVLDEIAEPRIRAGCVVGGIGQRENVLVLADGEALDFAELRVFELLRQQFQVVLAAGLLAGKALAEALHRAGGLRGDIESGLFHVDIRRGGVQENTMGRSVPNGKSGRLSKTGGNRGGPPIGDIETSQPQGMYGTLIALKLENVSSGGAYPPYEGQSMMLSRGVA